MSKKPLKNAFQKCPIPILEVSKFFLPVCAADAQPFIARVASDP